MSITIYHNPRCSKSRQALKLLQEKGHQPKVVEYLKTGLDKATINQLLTKLELPPLSIIRQKESLYKQARLAPQPSKTALIKLLIKEPILLERPIVIKGDKAVIGRPPEQVLNLL